VWGLPASRCRSRSRGVRAASASRSGSSTSPSAEGGPRGSSYGSESREYGSESREEIRRYESGSALIERAPYREHCGREIAQDHCGLEPNDAVAGTCELAIAARIRGHAPRVIAAIDLDDEARARHVEVSDEAEQRDLPPKGDAELTGAQRAPDPRGGK